jgi:hypothetical protein
MGHYFLSNLRSSHILHLCGFVNNVLATDYIVVINYNYEITGEQTNGNHYWSPDVNGQVTFK